MSFTADPPALLEMARRWAANSDTSASGTRMMPAGETFGFLEGTLDGFRDLLGSISGGSGKASGEFDNVCDSLQILARRYTEQEDRAQQSGDQIGER
ncbi:hypothetical protein EII42_12335 [Tessaracoccus sp. OH4464_COT-324]|nr:hypothetical protein EII42_12335 [Tessaracoccus sp. OH4464_COT-324]